MNDREIIRDFIRTAKAIYKLCEMDAAAESKYVGFPDSVTVGATLADGKTIEITITIKEEEDDEDVRES